MYQFRSTGALCSSKKIFETKPQMFAHLQQVIFRTEKYRKSISEDNLNDIKWARKVSQKELVENIVITSFDPKIYADSLEIFGTEKEISDLNVKKYLKVELERIKKMRQTEKEKFVIKII